MPRYLIERSFVSSYCPKMERKWNWINKEEGVAWIFSFLSADKKKTYCLDQGPDPEAIRAAARRNNIPVDAIIEIGGKSASICSPSAAPTIKPAGEPPRLSILPICGEPRFPDTAAPGRGEGRGGERRGGDGEEFGARPRSEVERQIAASRMQVANNGTVSPSASPPPSWGARVASRR